MRRSCARDADECKMPALKAAFESCRIHDVKTVLGSGNWCSTSQHVGGGAAAKAEAAMAGAPRFECFPRSCGRSSSSGNSGDRSLPPFKVSPRRNASSRFLRGRPKAKIKLPVEMDGARILAMRRSNLQRLSADSEGSRVHDADREDIWQEQTTRTWDTIVKSPR